MNKIFRPLASLLLASSFVGSVSAATRIWTGANATSSTNWSTNGNWSGNTVPVSTDIAEFDSNSNPANLVSGQSTVTAISDKTVAGIVFNASSVSYYVNYATSGTIRFYFGSPSATSISMGSTVSAAQTFGRVGLSGSGGNYTFVNNASDSAVTLTTSSVLNTTTGAANLVLDGTNTGNNKINFTISENTGAGALSIVKNGTGTWVLTSANTYTGGITQNNGTLLLETGTSQSTNADFTLNGGTVAVRGASSSVLGNGNLVINGGRVAAVGASGSRTIANNVSVNGDFAVGGSGDGTVAGYSTLATTFSGTVNLNNATRSLTFSNASATFANVISNGALVLNSDTPSLNVGATLSAANTYAGGTTINSGLHYANNVTAFGTGSLTMNGGELRLSNSTTPAALALQLGSGAQFLMNGGTWTAKLGTTFDQILGNGATFTISGGTLALDTTTLTGFDYGTTYQILSSFTGGSVSGLAITGYDTTNYIATLNNAGQLSFTSAIPELSTTAMIVGFMALAVVGIRRRRTSR